MRKDKKQTISNIVTRSKDCMDIVKALTKEEVRNFKLFLKRSNTNVADAPVSKLFDSMRNNIDWDDKTIFEKNFNHLKANAFRRLKNRTLVDVNKSLLVLNYNKDDRVLIYNYLSLSEVFLYKSEYTITYNFLCKAEKKAVENEFYSILETIYEQMTALSRHIYDLPLPEILEKKKAIIKKKKEARIINDMMAEVIWHLQQSNYETKGTDIIEELERTKNKLDNLDLIKQSPSLRIQMQKNIRMILLQKGDYDSLNKYLSQKLAEFEKDKLFNKNNHNQKIVMLTWLINTNIKRLDFYLVYQYCQQLKENLAKYKNLYYNTHIWTYYQCVFAACFYSNQLRKFLKILKTYAKEEVLKEHSLYLVYFNINSAIVYYSLNEIKKANEFLNRILEPDFFDALSNEMKLTIKIIELIFYFENKDYDYLSYSIKSIKKKYKSLLAIPKFERQLSFIKVLQSFGKDVSLNSPKTEQIINDFINNSATFEVGTNEAIHYQSWLIAKLKNKPYYSTLLANIKNLKDQFAVQKKK